MQGTVAVARSHWLRLALGVAIVNGAAMAQDAGPDEANVLTLSVALREQALSVLGDGLRSDEFWPSMHAAEALTQAGLGPEVRAALAARLPAENDPLRRCGLARELIRAGDRGQVDVLFEVLALSDLDARVHAAESLYKVAEVGDGRLLRQALEEHDKPSLEAMAAAALARCGSRRALALLRERLAGDDASGRMLAAYVLARLGDESDVPRLVANAGNETDPLGASFAINAAAALGDGDARATVGRNLVATDPAIRAYAAEAAGLARAVELADALAGLLSDETLDVRLRAAQALLALARQPVDREENISRDVFPASTESPRHSEGSILSLADGTQLYATTEFIGGTADHANSRIVARRSADGGRTWGEQETLQENVGRMNTMSVTLCRLTHACQAGSPIGMFYVVRDAHDDLRLELRVSRDEAATFAEPVRVSDQPGYNGMNNDRAVLLTGGRLVAPVCWTADEIREDHYVSFCYLSDDQGRTWRAGRGRVDFAGRGAMEPEVLELADGRLLMIVRTQQGQIAASRSEDGGDTWSEPQLWGVASPESPATLRRVPATGDLLLVWNPHYDASADHGGPRTPLAAAISTDEGRTWWPPRLLETDDRQGFAYTSLAFVGDRAVLSYYVNDDNGRVSSRFRSLPVRWFYQTDD